MTTNNKTQKIIEEEVVKIRKVDPMVEATNTIKKALDSYMNVDYSSKYRKQVLILHYLRTGQVEELKEKKEAWDMIYDYINTHHKAVQEYDKALKEKELKKNKSKK